METEEDNDDSTTNARIALMRKHYNERVDALKEKHRKQVAELEASVSLRTEELAVSRATGEEQLGEMRVMEHQIQALQITVGALERQCAEQTEEIEQLRWEVANTGDAL